MEILFDDGSEEANFCCQCNAIHSGDHIYIRRTDCVARKPSRIDRFASFCGADLKLVKKSECESSPDEIPRMRHRAVHILTNL